MKRKYYQHGFVLIMLLWGICQAGAPIAVITYNYGDYTPIDCIFKNKSQYVILYADDSYDTDEDGESIVDYGWTWSRYDEPDWNSGATGCYIFACKWDTVGDRTIYLAVKDDEGQWSNYVSIGIHVVDFKISTPTTSPSSPYKAVFDGLTDVCVIECEGTTGTAQFNDDLDWVWSGCSVSPTTMDVVENQTQVTITYENLPYYPGMTTVLGEKTLELRLMYNYLGDDVIALKNTAFINLYYPPDAYTNPQVAYPNWWYYMYNHNTIPGIQDCVWYPNGEGGGYYCQTSHYPFNANTIYIYPGAHSTWSYSMTWTNKYVGSVYSGTDHIANSEPYGNDEWVDPPFDAIGDSSPLDDPMITSGSDGMLDPSTISNLNSGIYNHDDHIVYTMDWTYNVNFNATENVAAWIVHLKKHQENYTNRYLDTDHDNIKDSWETGPTYADYKLKVGDDDTYDLEYPTQGTYPEGEDAEGDDDFTAWMAEEEAKNSLGIDEEEDWSEGGMNW